MDFWKLSFLLAALTCLGYTWGHHCADPDMPFKKIQECPKNLTHVCYNLVEDLQSFTCRCVEAENCKEPCGMNIFRAWSSPEGSWIGNITNDSTIPFIGIDKYLMCAKNLPQKPKDPHKLNYTMCMCNDHYYSFGITIASSQKKNFTQNLKETLKNEKPKMYVLGSEYHSKNLPYVTTDSSFKYRECVDISEGETFQPKGHLGEDWCDIKYCEQNNPYGKGRKDAKYKVMKCAETCTCFLEPNAKTLKKAATRNKEVEEIKRKLSKAKSS